VRGLDLTRFAAGGLRGHRLRSVLTVLGVGIGVAAVVILTSLGEGARRFVVGEFASLGSNLVIVVPGKTETVGAAPLVSTAPNDLTLADAQAVERQVSAVTRVAPLSLGTARIELGERSRQTTVIGTTHAMLEVRKLSMAIGRYVPSDTTDGPICVLGAKVSRELFGARNPLGAVVRIGGARHRVIGVIAPRGTSIGMDLDETVAIPVEGAMRLFDRSSLFRILCEVRRADQIESAQKRITAVLTERHGEEDVTVITQDAVLDTFDNIFKALTVALGAIAAISLAVAGIGIMNVMLVAVSERTREIGLLKALGVTQRQVLSVFLVEATVISVTGGLLGLAAGLGGARLLRTLVPGFPVQPPAWAVILAVAVSTLVGLGFGLLPAQRAMKLDPVEALMRQRT